MGEGNRLVDLGEVGHYSLGTTDALPGTVNLPDYWTWNVGATFTQGVFTVDFRYYDTDTTKRSALRSPATCVAGLTATARSSHWCSPTFIVATKFDLTVLTNVK
jgi:hypothetical protein